MFKLLYRESGAYSETNGACAIVRNIDLKFGQVIASVLDCDVTRTQEGSLQVDMFRIRITDAVPIKPQRTFEAH